MSAPERIVVEHGANRIVHVWEWIGPAQTTGIPPKWFREDYIRADLARPLSQETVERLKRAIADGPDLQYSGNVRVETRALLRDILTEIEGKQAWPP